MGSPTSERAVARTPRGQPRPAALRSQVPRTGQRLRTSSPPPSSAAPPPAPGTRPPRPPPGPQPARPAGRYLAPWGFRDRWAILPFLPHRHTLFPLGRPRRNFRSSPGNPAIALPEVARPAVRNPEAGPVSRLGAAMLRSAGPLPVILRYLLQLLDRASRPHFHHPRPSWRRPSGRRGIAHCH
jgi:hypothetical protein